MQTKTLRQSVTFNAAPAAIYHLLMDSKQHAKFTGDKAKIGQHVGEPFMAFNGYCFGTQVELIPNKKIVQTWRASNWPKDHFSIATFELRKIKGGTRLIFTQAALPVSKYKDIADGWKSYYWNRMQEALG